MKKRQSIFALLVALVLVMSLVVVGHGQTKKPVKLKIGLPGSYDVTSKEIIDKFIATHPHINVEIQEAPWGDFTSKIATQIAGNTMPDVWFQENAVILGYGQRGVAEDLAPYIARDLNVDEYIDGLFSARTPEGKVWGVPHGINPVALAYNKTVFEEAGVPFPTDDWTYADLIETAKKLTVKEGDEPKRFGFIGAYAITNGWFPWIKQAGGSALDETKTKSMFDDPRTVAGLKQLRQGIEEGYFTNVDFNKAHGGDLAVFAGGKAAMHFMQYSLQVNMQNQFPDTDWDVVKMPKAVNGERYVPMVGNTWLISSRASKDAKEAAWEFLRFYLSDEVQDIVAASGSTLPVKKSAYAVVENAGTKPLNKKAYTEGIAEGGVTLDENATWNEWRLLVQQQVNESVVHGKISVEEAAAEIHKRVQAVLDENK